MVVRCSKRFVSMVGQNSSMETVQTTYPTMLGSGVEWGQVLENSTIL